MGAQAEAERLAGSRGVVVGAIRWVVGSVQLVIAMAITQLGYSGYSLRSNYISDLGATQCRNYGSTMSGVTYYVCSPWHHVFNVSAILLGLLIVLGALLVKQSLPRPRLALVGLLLPCLTGIGAILVGGAPENVNGLVHSIGGLLVFVLGNLALVLLGFAVAHDPSWKGYFPLGVILGVLGLADLAWPTSLAPAFWGPGYGERIIVGTLLLWVVVVGLHLLRAPRDAKYQTTDYTASASAVQG